MMRQVAYRITCPDCGYPGAQLRVAYPYTDPVRGERPVVVMFSCINATEEDHGNPSEAQLLALVPPPN